jgi:hypothetical protein
MTMATVIERTEAQHEVDKYAQSIIAAVREIVSRSDEATDFTLAELRRVDADLGAVLDEMNEAGEG